MKHATAAVMVLIAALGLASAASADEGLWTFDGFPAARMRAAHGFAPDQAWLDHVRLSSARLTGGCSSSLVSADGLLLTNHHCVADCAQNLSTPADDRLKDGFLARDRTKERACPGQQAEILTGIADVTGRIVQAIGAATGEALVKARDAAIARIESQGCTDRARQRCQVVTLYGGAQYKLYSYRKYSDVRLVFAPEYAIGQFGGDPDNFNFPRYGLDAAFLRLYEDGRPVATPTHLKWNPRAPEPGEIVFAAGNPGTTFRLFTRSQVAVRRDLVLPVTLVLLSELRGRLLAEMAGDPEKARTGAASLESVENSFKAYAGQHRALLDPAFAAKLDDGERELRASVAADPALAAKVGDPWADLGRASEAYRALYLRYTLLEPRAGYTADLYGYAVKLVRAAQERAKPNAERLPAYSDSALPLLEKQLLDPEPIAPWLEELKIGFWLARTREYLTVDDPAVKTLLGRESPEALAHRLVSGTRLADPKVREALFKGGLRAITASDDPLIRYVLATEGQARAVLAEYRARVDGPSIAAQAKLAQARLAVDGAASYPDATFTLRLTYGQVAGWSYQGRTIAPTTNLAGLYDRATGAAPFALPPRWVAARGVLDPATVLDFSTTLDSIGGNSGSPTIARDGSVIGALFDGNIHSLGGSFGYDPVLNRSIIVSNAAVQAALAKVYHADALLAELGGS